MISHWTHQITWQSGTVQQAQRHKKCNNLTLKWAHLPMTRRATLTIYARIVRCELFSSLNFSPVTDRQMGRKWWIWANRACLSTGVLKRGLFVTNMPFFCPAPNNAESIASYKRRSVNNVPILSLSYPITKLTHKPDPLCYGDVEKEGKQCKLSSYYRELCRSTSRYQSWV